MPAMARCSRWVGMKKTRIRNSASVPYRQSGTAFSGTLPRVPRLAQGGLPLLPIMNFPELHPPFKMVMFRKDSRKRLRLLSSLLRNGIRMLALASYQPCCTNHAASLFEPLIRINFKFLSVETCMLGKHPPGMSEKS